MDSDRELIESANNGDSEAFEALYFRYRDWVYRLALRSTSNQQDALDVVQETFIYLLGKFPGFKLTASMTTFLYPVVRHISATIRSKNRRFSAEKNTTGEPVFPAPEPGNTSRSEQAAVLVGLPDEQREVVLMRFVDDMSLNEIATALNIPLSTVKSRLYNALEKLRYDNRTRHYFLE